ncbi:MULTISPECIES: beta-ketoacyl synthase N-terminal-like domain-containing protein [Micromonospora]|uniref:beta-ketoacyl synthase N-terminal-like domain-containing protein n=1 Tax=Micromonospora TaxID=1873 RepID=UPI00137924F6|nr:MULTISPECIES: beta-ketoacyl synthase N-terminal-like domain-containing protein [Micromonospora]MDG4750880.1 beta-ketoacyl synthase N-terminal-like domain-containing protein [Micromonospora sp. WMMD718]UFN96859.1 hypothetical protein LF814_12340 [Micromonospora aurantiaca]
MDVVTALGGDLPKSYAAFVAGRVAFGLTKRFDTDGMRCRSGAFLDTDLSAAELLTSLVERACPDGLTVDRAYVASCPDEPVPPLPAVVSRTGRSGGPGGWDRAYTGACVASSSALIDAASAVANGWADSVLVAATRLVDRENFAIFDAGGALTTAERPFPHTTRRAGVLLGDGAAMFVLRAAAAPGREVAHPRPRLQVCGWGRAGDGFHQYEPHPEGRGMADAVAKALAVAGIPAGDIAVISVHGTGTRVSDTAEARALSDIFGSPEQVPPTHAPKGATGHLLEAAGAVEAALLHEAMGRSEVPASPGATPDNRLSPSVAVRTSPQRVRFGLSMNMAFGGSNTALVLSHPGYPAPGPATPVRPGALVATVPAVVDPEPVPGFMGSGFPPAVHSAAERCLTAAALTADQLIRTAVILLTPDGDAENHRLVAEKLDSGSRIPPPLFVQGTPASILGRVAQEWGLRQAHQTFAADQDPTHPDVRRIADELAATDGCDAVLVVRHRCAGGADAALFRYAAG